MSDRALRGGDPGTDDRHLPATGLRAWTGSGRAAIRGAPAAAPSSRDEAITYPDRYGKYFDDTFGLRDSLLRWHSIEKYFVFGVSPSQMVTLGREQWMFLATMSSMEIFRGVTPLSTDELERWRQALESQRDFLRRRGIEYVYVIAPNKESIYPDYVAPVQNRVGPTRMDQLIAYLEAHSDFRILDLRPAMLAARALDLSDEHLYFELGTHWNGRGGWVAAREVQKQLHQCFPAIRPTEPSELTRIISDDLGDTQARSMYIADLVPQRHTLFELAAPTRRHVLSTAWDSDHPRIEEIDDPALPRALVFHDSFGAGIEPVLGECFRRSTWINRMEFDTSAIEAERPDVVIELFVERVFATPPPPVVTEQNPDAVTAASAVEAARTERYRLDLAQPAITLEAKGKTLLERGRDDEGEFISIAMREGADTFLLPEIDWHGASWAVVELDITTEVPTALTVFYLRGKAQEYTRRSSQSAQLARGRNRLVIPIAAGDLHGRLMIRPGAELRRYRLRGLEVRVVGTH